MGYNFDTILDRRSSNSIKWTLYSEDVLPLWVADMDFVSPQPILDALHEKLAQGALGYERPPDSLLETVAARMDRLYSWKIEPDMVIATPGIVSGFNAAARAVCEPPARTAEPGRAGDGVLMQPPVYFPFLGVHENLGFTRQFAPLVKVTDGNIIRYEIDFDAFEAAMGSEDARTRLFLFCNPHNPTGNAFTKNDLSRLAEICLRHNVLICSDEIHSELLLGGTQHTPLATLSSEIAEQSITLIAPSKTFNTAGLFCGFAIIPNPEMRERYQKAAEQMTLHVNSLGQIAAQAAFSGACDDWLKEALAYMTANRDFAVSYIKEHLPEIRQTVPDATYLSWLDCNPLLESRVITGSPFEFFLNEAKVALSDGSPFGPGGEGFVRLNFACPRSTLEEALDRMRQALAR
jgi:cysteine-S-conjugate beta-lyase